MLGIGRHAPAAAADDVRGRAVPRPTRWPSRLVRASRQPVAPTIPPQRSCDDGADRVTGRRHRGERAGHTDLVRPNVGVGAASPGTCRQPAPLSWARPKRWTCCSVSGAHRHAGGGRGGPRTRQQTYEIWRPVVSFAGSGRRRRSTRSTASGVVTLHPH
jgi:hypothetical protein